MPYRYQGRADQARSIAQARHWVARLAQLATFESVVLRDPPVENAPRDTTPDAWPEPHEERRKMRGQT